MIQKEPGESFSSQWQPNLCGRRSTLRRQTLLSSEDFVVDSPLPHSFVLAHVHGGDRMFGTRLHLPVHLPLGALRPGLQQVHPLLGFDPAGNRERERGGGKERERGVNFISGQWLMCEVGGQPPRASSGPPFLAWRHGKKAIPLDESITEMNEDGSAMMHEARRLGSALGHDAPALSVRLWTTHAGHFIMKCGYLEASRVALWAANEKFIQFKDNIIRTDWFCGGASCAGDPQLFGDITLHM